MAGGKNEISAALESLGAFIASECDQFNEVIYLMVPLYAGLNSA